jgi:hypothetical protein
LLFALTILKFVVSIFIVFKSTVQRNGEYENWLRDVDHNLFLRGIGCEVQRGKGFFSFLSSRRRRDHTSDSTKIGNYRLRSF